MRRSIARREFLRLSALATSTTLLSSCGAPATQPGGPLAPAAQPGAAPAATTATGKAGAGMGAGASEQAPKRFASFITPNEYFYITVYSSVEPAIDRSTWALTLRGLGGREQRLTYDQLLALPDSAERMVTMECVGNGVGGSLISNAAWRGVPLATVLQRFGVDESAYKVVLRAADGYHSAIPLEVALDGQTLLAWQMNGVDLPQNHGYPVRVIVPGKYGMKSPKWLTEIELVTSDYLGYWESRGWDDLADIQPYSRFTDPLRFTEVASGPLAVRGLAFGGARAVGQVEISLDKRRSWQPAALSSTPEPYVWSFWDYSWDLAGRAGRSSAQLVVRCSDTDGERQKESAPPQLPDGLQTHEAGLDTLEVIVQA